ncbi:voltage-gated anion channel [Scopulibacillus darangshiensis]|uniref:Voltage-gated anion channel n=1 Tax=Scopulibacillus darangshiensis TaxID=442528 RepID=A0A4R2NPX0_9BACL|nr:hypothetical protein [Scopulibacillus darangshiensis]TCP23491.1 voltage-gated anion channel [Scopulibacillus darangshiensis]
MRLLKTFGNWLFLFVGMGLAYSCIGWLKPVVLADIIAFFILFTVFYYFRRLMFKPAHAATAAGAIVMSMGVFVSDALKTFPDYIESLGKVTVMMIFIIWLFLITDYTVTLFRRKFFDWHWSGSLNSFAMGTWLAGSSVCSMGLLMYLKDWYWVAVMIITVNSCLWVIFASLCVRRFFQLVKEKGAMIHGIVLLSTVSTQSLVVDYSILLGRRLPMAIYYLLMILALIFYVCYLFLIVRQHIRSSWQLAEDWKNTNCIIHGALSITGLAGILSGVIQQPYIYGLWWLVLCLIIAVETIEIVRAVLRVKAKGFREGLGQYDVSQWARNFTISMFLAFTLNLPAKELTAFWQKSYEVFLDGFSIIVVLLFAYEAVLLFRARLKKRSRSALN